MPLLKEPGTYTVTVKSAALGQSEEKKTPFLSLLFAADNGDEITGFLYLSDAAFEKTVSTLRKVFGFDDDFPSVVEQVTGKEAEIVVEVEEYNGKSRSRVKWINKAGGTIQSAPIANQASFLSQLAAKAKRIPGQPQKAQPAARVAAKAQADNPF